MKRLSYVRHLQETKNEELATALNWNSLSRSGINRSYGVFEITASLKVYQTPHTDANGSDVIRYHIPQADKSIIEQNAGASWA